MIEMPDAALVILMILACFISLNVGYRLGWSMRGEQEEIYNEHDDRAQRNPAYQEARRASMRRHPSYHMRAIKED